jgi:hypothetical protein
MLTALQVGPRHPRPSLQPPGAQTAVEMTSPTRYDLLAPQTFNIAYDTSIFSLREASHTTVRVLPLGLAFTGARSAEFVDGEKKSPKDGCLEALFGRKAIEESFSGEDEDGLLVEDSRGVAEILSQETVGRGRPKWTGIFTT